MKHTVIVLGLICLAVVNSAQSQTYSFRAPSLGPEKYTVNMNHGQCTLLINGARAALQITSCEANYRRDNSCVELGIRNVVATPSSSSYFRVRGSAPRPTDRDNDWLNFDLWFNGRSVPGYDWSISANGSFDAVIPYADFLTNQDDADFTKVQMQNCAID